MARYVFRDKETGEELPFSTLEVVRTKMIPTKVRCRLWDSEGNRLPAAQLAELGLEAVEYPDQSEEWQEWKNFTSMYEAFPEAAERVQEYKDLMDEIGCSYSATTNEVEAAVRAKFTDDLQGGSEMIDKINAALLNVKVNYQAWAIAAGLSAFVGNDFTTWLHMPILIKYLPSNNPAEPAYREPTVLS
jgi:hypothetical protein